MEKLYPIITSMSALNKGLYLESFFSTKLDIDCPISLPAEDLFFPVDLRFGFYGIEGNNDYFAFVATPKALGKHKKILKDKKVITIHANPVHDMISSINQTIELCSSSDPETAFFELSKFYEWEFENYRVTDD